MPIITNVDVVCACHEPPRPGLAVDVGFDGVRRLVDVCRETNDTVVKPLRALHERGRVFQEVIPPGYAGNLAKVWPNARGLESPRPRTPPKKGGARSSAKQGSSTQAGDPDLVCLVPRCGHRLGTSGGINFHMQNAHHGLSLAQCMPHVATCGLCGPEAGDLSGSGKLGWHMRKAHEHMISSAKGKSLTLLMIGRTRSNGDPHGALTDMDNFIEDFITERRKPSQQEPVAGLADSPPDGTEVAVDNAHEGGH